MRKIKTILLIDDDEINNFYVQYLLDQLFEVGKLYIAINGEEALRIMGELQQENISIDLILLDINMPVMDGFEFLAEYDRLPKENRSKTVISMLSSSVHSEDLKRSKAHQSIDTYLEKPLTKEKLYQIIAAQF